MNGPRFARVAGKPDWVMIGQRDLFAGYLVFGSLALTEAELKGAADAAQRAAGRQQGETGPQRGYRLSAWMTDVAVAWGPDYPTAMKNLLENWIPPTGTPEHAIGQEQRAIGAESRVLRRGAYE